VSTTIRPVRPEEHEAVGTLVLVAYDEVGAMSAGYRRQLADTAGRIGDGATVLVAVDATLLGTVTLVTSGSPHFEHEGHGDGGIRMLAVAPAAQGRGVGTSLVEHVVEHGRQHGWRRIALTTMEWMHGARRLYERLGFDRRPDLDVRYPAGTGHAYTLDLIPDAAAWFPPPGPVPDEPPWYEDVERPT
jgi:ribosomal protein S18 acetylase RimI-like enzyme